MSGERNRRGEYQSLELVLNPAQTLGLEGGRRGSWIGGATSLPEGTLGGRSSAGHPAPNKLGSKA